MTDKQAKGIIIVGGCSMVIVGVATVKFACTFGGLIKSILEMNAELKNLRKQL